MRLALLSAVLSQKKKKMSTNACVSHKQHAPVYEWAWQVMGHNVKDASSAYVRIQTNDMRTF